jgi:hypothetical protein
MLYHSTDRVQLVQCSAVELLRYNDVSWLVSDLVERESPSSRDLNKEVQGFAVLEAVSE